MIVEVFKYIYKGIAGLIERFGGFKKVVTAALKVAFAPLFLAIGAIKLVIAGAKKLAGFFGGLFGGGEEAAPKPRKQSRSARQREYRKRTNKPRRFETFDEEPSGASPVESMAAGSIVNTATSAIVGEAGPEAVVRLGDKFYLSTSNELLTTLIAQSKAGTDKLTKKVGDMGVSG